MNYAARAAPQDGTFLTIVSQIARGDLTLRGRVSNDALGNVVRNTVLTGIGTSVYEYKTFDALGRMVHDVYLFEVKKPSESKGRWDDYKLLATIPGSEAFQSLELSRCPLVKK